MLSKGDEDTLNIYEIGLLRYNITEGKQVSFGKFSFSSRPSSGFNGGNRSASSGGKVGVSADSDPSRGRYARGSGVCVTAGI